MATTLIGEQTTEPRGDALDPALDTFPKLVADNPDESQMKAHEKVQAKLFLCVYPAAWLFEIVGYLAWSGASRGAGTSQIFTVPSSPAEARCLPSGWNATAQTPR